MAWNTLPVTATFAIFGKLPVAADFVRKGDLILVALLESWFAPVWEDIQLSASSSWNEHYRIAPLWWFALPHGGESIVGILSPSLDAVGRFFPLIVARKLPGDHTLAFRDASQWLSAVELAVLAALEPPGCDLEQLIVASVADIDVNSCEALIEHKQHATEKTVLLKDPRGWSPMGYGPSVLPAPHWSIWQAGPCADTAYERRLFDGWPNAQQLDQLIGAARTESAVQEDIALISLPVKLQARCNQELKSATVLRLDDIAALIHMPPVQDLIILTDREVMWLCPKTLPGVIRAVQRYDQRAIASAALAARSNITSAALAAHPKSTSAVEPTNYQEIFANCSFALAAKLNVDHHLMLSWFGSWRLQYKDGSEPVNWGTGPLLQGSGEINARHLNTIEISLPVAQGKEVSWFLRKQPAPIKRLVIELSHS